MKTNLIVLCSLFVLTGCGTQSIETTTIWIDNVQLDIPVTYEKKVSDQEYNAKLWNRPVLVFVEKWLTVTDFEKNILITKVAFNPKISSLDSSMAIMVDTIKSSFGSYEKNSLTTKSYTCGNEKKDLYLHSFSMVQWDIQSPQTYYVTQYYFVEGQWLYVISGISNDQDDWDNYESYFKSLKCKE